jgi:hypothetical protein
MKAKPAERKAHVKERFDFKQVARFVLGWLGFLFAVAAVVLLVRFLYEHR